MVSIRSAAAGWHAVNFEQVVMRAVKATCYLRVGRKNGRARWGDSEFVFDVGVKEPKSGLTHLGQPVSTAVLQVNLILPDEVFGPCATVDIDVPPEAIRHVVTGEAVQR